MLRLFASRINDFQKLLATPKSVPASIATTFGRIEPLGFERFRICELYAELLHCSNMVLLNDARGEEIVKQRDGERDRLRKEGHSKPPSVDIWGDTDLGNGKRWGTSEAYSSDGSEIGNSKAIENQELPTNHVNEKGSGAETAPKLVSPEFPKIEGATHIQSDLKSQPSPEVYQEKSQSRVLQSEKLEATSSNLVGSPSESHLKGEIANSTETQNSVNKNGDAPQNAHISSNTSVKTRPVVGDYLKMQFVEAKVLPSVVDLFFAHPWNNFLHNVVYDILTQVLNGPMDKGFNRQLAVDLFTTGQLTEKILQGQKASDEAQ